MRNVDLSNFSRTAIGFDRLARLIQESQRTDQQPSYPPYNIEQVADDQYRITMAVAGFDIAELDIEVERDTLKITGRKTKTEQGTTYLYRGIANRDFEHRFRLADQINVVGSSLENGLLSISLVRIIPEALKPRKIVIGGGENVHTLERMAA